LFARLLFGSTQKIRRHHAATAGADIHAGTGRSGLNLDVRIAVYNVAKRPFLPGGPHSKLPRAVPNQYVGLFRSGDKRGPCVVDTALSFQGVATCLPRHG
jgi:hypothetical protein